MKCKSIIKILSITLLSTILGSSTVFAAEGDIYNISNLNNIILKYTQAQIGISTKKQNEVMNNASINGYELSNGKIYSLEQINYAINDLYTKNPKIDNDMLINQTFVNLQNTATPIADTKDLTMEFELDNIY